MINYYHLQRNKDHSGNSGTGIVADVFELQDGGAIVLWREGLTVGVTSAVVYKSINDVTAIHGHGGDTVLVEQPNIGVHATNKFSNTLEEYQGIIDDILSELYGDIPEDNFTPPEDEED